MKKIFKSRGFWCLITALVVGTVSVSAATYFPSVDVTYDNKESGLVSTDVQGAIDELYNTCSSSMISGEYIYYAVNHYKASLSTQYSPLVIVNGGVLYKCNLNGEKCEGVLSSSGYSEIKNIYVTTDYLYYVVNNYQPYIFEDSYYTNPVGGQFYRCDLNGDNCKMLVSSGDRTSIGGVYVTKDYMYYAVNKYRTSLSSSIGAYVFADGSVFYRCSLSGENCTSINAYESWYSIN